MGLDNDLSPAAYLLALVFLLFRCTRGFEGISVVCDFTLKKWTVVESNFDKTCKELVAHCEAVCRRTCKSQLSHREGLHTMYSGIHFLRTLLRADCRKRIKSVAKKIAPVISRLLHLRGRTSLTASEIISIGESIHGCVALAIQRGRLKLAGKYNAMDCTRCFMLVCENIFRCHPIKYVETQRSSSLETLSKCLAIEMLAMISLFRLS